MTVHPKVVSSAVGAGVGSALVTVIVWGFALAHIYVPIDVQSALGVLFSAAVAGVSGYLTPTQGT